MYESIYSDILSEQLKIFRPRVSLPSRGNLIKGVLRNIYFIQVFQRFDLYGSSTIM